MNRRRSTGDADSPARAAPGRVAVLAGGAAARADRGAYPLTTTSGTSFATGLARPAPSHTRTTSATSL